MPDRSSTFQSSDTTIATVNKSGIVTAKEVGTAKITVTSKTNKKSKKPVTITVKKKAEETTQAPDPEKPSDEDVTTPQRPEEPMKAPVYSNGVHHESGYVLDFENHQVLICLGLDSPEDCFDLMTPKYYTNVELGFLYTTENLDENTIVLGSTAPKVSKGNINICSTKYSTGFAISEKIWNTNPTVKVRIYSVLTNVEGTTETIYSDILSVPLTDNVE